MKYSNSRIFWMLGSLLVTLHAFANRETFPLPGRLFGAGSAGTTAGTLGDLMLPLYGSPSGMLYGDVQGKYYRDETWFGGLAGGFRQKFAQNILGGYLFVDRNESINSKHYWSLNPGVEAINSQWDAHLNGYFPIDKKNQQLGSAWADELGDYRYISFSGHQQFDHILVNTEAAGQGTDAEIGYRIERLNNLRLAVGGYYFNFHDVNNNMKGIIGTVEYPFNERVSILAQDSYDNLQHNTFMLTVRLRFGQINPEEGRMLEPIRRSLGTLGSGTSIPTERAWVDSGPNLLEKDHIWFFKPNGQAYNPAAGLNNCTAEHPCSSNQLTQQQINGINAVDPNSHLYLAPGVYLLDPGMAGTERISLYEGQSIEGRSFDFAKPAMGDERPKLIGGINMSGNLVASIILNNQIDDSALASLAQVNHLPQLTTSQTIGIQVTRNSNIIENVTIGTSGDLNGYTTGVLVDNTRYVLIDRSQINAGGINQNTRGIRARNAFVEIRNSKIDVQAVGTSNFTTFAEGIEIGGLSQLFVSRTNFEVSANSVTSAGTVATGILANDLTTMQVVFNSFTVRAIQNSNVGNALAIGINNNTFVPTDVNFEGFSQVVENQFRVFALSRFGQARAEDIRDSRIQTVRLIQEDNH